MTVEMDKNSKDNLTAPRNEISYVEGYPLYPFFKKIYEDYLNEINADADRLLKTLKENGIPAPYKRLM